MKHDVRAFTLLELMVVVAIVGLMAAIAVPAYSKMTCKAEQDEAKVAVATIAKLSDARREDLVDYGTNVATPITVPCGGDFPQNPFGFGLKGRSRYRYNLTISTPTAQGNPVWSVQAIGCGGLPVQGDFIQATNTSPFPSQLANACRN